MPDSLAEIYEEIPKLNCKGLCVQACTVIQMAPVERENIRLAILLEGKGTMPRRIRDLSEQEVLDLTTKGIVPKCPALMQDNRCSIYLNRPLICRLFGVVKDMPCPHGCKPNVWLPKHRAHSLIDRSLNLPVGKLLDTKPDQD